MISQLGFDCIPISKLVYQCYLLQNNCCLWILPFVPTNLLLFNKEYGLCRYSQNWLMMLQLPCADLLLTQLHLLALQSQYVFGLKQCVFL